MQKKQFLFLALLGALAVLISCGQATQETVDKSAPEVTPEASVDPPPPPATFDFNLDEQGRALGGYDAVAYHQSGNAVEGSTEFTSSWGGATWHFSSEENKNLFVSEPEKYAPSNGGYCTFGIILKKKLDGNPQTYLLKEGKLYMFLNEEVREKFLLDESGNLEKVASNWPEMKAQ